MAKLTDLSIKNLTCPPGRTHGQIEEKNLVFRIYKSGNQVWFFRYSLAGKSKLLGLGDYPTMTLAQARKKALELRVKVREGGDPASEFKEARKQRIEATTMKDLTKAYLEEYAKPRKKSWKDDKRYIDGEILPKWKDTLLSEISREDVIELINKIRNRNSPVAAERCLSLLKTMFKYAIEIASPPLLEGYPPTLTVPKNKAGKSRERNLKESEIKYLWERLTEKESNLVMSSEIKRALMLTLLTAQRPGEVIGMHRREITGNWWEIPSERVKNQTNQLVYLTPLALQIIGNKPGYIFESGDSGEPMLQMAMSHAVRRNITGQNYWRKGKKDSTKAKIKAIEGVPLLEMEQWTPHDLRRTAATMLSKIGYENVSIDIVLNHIRKENAMALRYNRNANRFKIKDMLTEWSKTLEKIISGEVTDAETEFSPEAKRFAAAINEKSNGETKLSLDMSPSEFVEKQKELFGKVVFFPNEILNNV